MKRKSFLLPLTAIAALLSLGLSACGGGQGGQSGNGGNQQQSTAQLEKITITAADSKTKLILGESVQLTASVDGVTWESDHPEIAAVSAAGVVESKGVGSAKITAKKDGFKDGTITIRVELEKITVTAAENKTQLLVAETVKLTASKEGVTWKSSDETVATVDQTGLVTAVKFGSATITASKEGFDAGSIEISVVRPAANATFDLTTAADHYSADGWWELPSAGGMMFSMENSEGFTPLMSAMNWMGGDTDTDTYIGGFDVGDKETVKFTSSKAVKAEIVVDMGNSDAIALATVMSVKLNDKALDLTGIELEEHQGQWGNSLEFANVSLGEQDIVSGENTLVFEFLSNAAPRLNEVVLYAGDAVINLINPAVKEQIAVVADELEVIEGETVKIETAVEGVSYSSVDETIATVDQTGVVTGVKMGKTEITVKKEGMYSIRVEITVNPKPVAGQIIVEAEDGEEVSDDYQSGGLLKMTDGGMGGMGGSVVHSGGAYVTAWQGSDLTLTLKFTATENAVMVLSIVGSAPMSMGGEASDFVFADSLTITLNEEAVATGEAKFAAGGGWNSPMEEVEIGEVNVKAGENTLVVTFGSSIPSLDCFKLTPKA